MINAVDSHARVSKHIRHKSLKGYVFYEYTAQNLFHSVCEDGVLSQGLLQLLPYSYAKNKKKAYSYLQSYFDQTNNNINLYINIPFCRQKCGYCHYCTKTITQPDSALVQHYVAALIKEMESVFNTFSLCDRISFVALGGGTPLSLPLQYLQRIFALLTEKNICNHSLLSIETTPAEICLPEGREKLLFLKDHGVERISLGVQSFSPDILRRIGACHTRDMVMHAYDIIRECGLKQVNIDLLCCLCDEHEESQLGVTLTALKDLKPEAVSVYRLNCLEKIFDRFFPQAIYDLEKNSSILKTIYDTLTDLGYMRLGRHYVRSDEAIRAREEPIVKWLVLEDDWLAFGANGRSTIGSIGFRNVKDISLYSNCIKKGIFPIVSVSTFNKRASMVRYVIGAIVRTCRINKNEFYDTFHIAFEDVFYDSLRLLYDTGLVYDDDDSLSITAGNEIIDQEIINILCGEL